jgi:anthranilate phosphoribosyltransferase
MLKELTQKINEGTDLVSDEMKAAMEMLMTGSVDTVLIKDFLIALRDKGESVEEIAAAASVMRKHAVVGEGLPENCVDTCGTGGDQKGTFNISTAAAFVIAGAGIPVAKHGNRSVSSRSGSADVLEALGVKLDLSPEKVKHCIESAGIGFFFARSYHPAMKHVAAARQKIGTRTIFNLLGPLTNPAGVRRQVMGVYAEHWCEPLAQVLGSLGSVHVMVVHGNDGMDELTLTGPSFIAEWKEGSVHPSEINPEELGLRLCKEKDLQGGDVKANAQMLKGILEGYQAPVVETVILNASAGLVVGGRVQNLRDGLEVARKSLAQGHAMNCLTNLIKVSQL